MQELDNRYRKYLGLSEVLPSWTRIEVCDEVFYHDGKNLLKEIRNDKNGYFECNLNTPLPEKFKKSVINKFKPTGAYFCYSYPHVWIGNFVSQRTFMEDVTYNIDEWLDIWVRDTTEDDLNELAAFANQPRIHQKYREDDFFAFKTGRRTWGFGRIIYDIYRRRKTDEFTAGKNYGLTNLMGHALIVQVYHYISSTTEIDINTLKDKKMLPSQPILDNRFLYGDYTIIGNVPVEDSEIIPIESYGHSLNKNEKFFYLQYGLTYREKKTPPLFLKKTYRNEDIGFKLHANESLIKACIEAGNNDPYWKQDFYYVLEDLRNPANSKDRRRIFRHFGL